MRLRDRQAGIYERATGLLPMSRWLADRTLAAGIAAADRIHVVNPGVNAPLDQSVPVPERPLRLLIPADVRSGAIGFKAG